MVVEIALANTPVAELYMSGYMADNEFKNIAVVVAINFPLGSAAMIEFVTPVG